jgi:glyoxylase-like metal-dependent hydrolase (beta-lactamase superfamily II)
VAEIKILIEGFTNADRRAAGQEEMTACTSVLVRDGKYIIVSDPGVLESQEIMIDALAKENLTVKDITHVFLTHSHIDHYRNIGMFPQAKTIEFFGIWDGGKRDDRTESFTENIQILETPGHSSDALTMLVKTKDGIYAVAGDLWWSKKGPEIDPFAFNMKELAKQRKRVLELADYIAPGHGCVFGSKDI